MGVKTCCITGHRDFPAEKTEVIKEELYYEILIAVADGYTHFISGFAKGIDLLFASIVAELMAQHPALTLEAALPCRNRLDTTDILFHRLLEKCSEITVHSEEYSPGCFKKRNRHLVSQSQRVIAVYDGRETGGTYFTMRYALETETGFKNNHSIENFKRRLLMQSFSRPFSAKTCALMYTNFLLFHQYYASKNEGVHSTVHATGTDTFLYLSFSISIRCLLPCPLN